MESDGSTVSIKVDILGLRGVKLAGGAESGALKFDVSAKMEEKERKGGRLAVGFVLTVGTNPSLAKFEVEGIATLEGKNYEIQKLLEVDPKTKIPFLLHRVYQHVFMSTFVLATLLGASYPPPDLLFSGEIGKARDMGPVDRAGKTGKEPEEKKRRAKPKARR